MRKKDRQVTDPVKIDEIIEKCECCRIALIDGDKCIYCLIEDLDDVVEYEQKENELEIRTEQNKNYKKPFTLNNYEETLEDLMALNFIMQGEDSDFNYTDVMKSTGKLY